MLLTSLPVDFLVMRQGEPLLSLQTSLELGFVQLDSSVFEDHNLASLLTEFKDLFNSDPGCVQGVEVGYK